MSSFPLWNNLPDDMRGEIRTACPLSARILLALTCCKELVLLPKPRWPLKENDVNPKHVDLVLEQVPGVSCSDAIAALRLQKGDVVDAIMLVSMDPKPPLIPPKPSLLKLAFKEGHLNLVKCYRSQLFKNSSYHLKAYKYGHLDIIQWLMEKEPVEMTKEFNRRATTPVCLAAYSGSMPLLHCLEGWCKKNLDIWFYVEITRGAFLGEHVHILEWLFNMDHLTWYAMGPVITDRKFKWTIPLLAFFIQDTPSPGGIVRRVLLEHALHEVNITQLDIPDESKAWLAKNGFPVPLIPDPYGAFPSVFAHKLAMVKNQLANEVIGTMSTDGSIHLKSYEQ
jgi:hypothetical protein